MKMEVIKTIKELRERLRRESLVACVPTMGNIHDGHLSLVRIARGHAPVTVTTIFVNRLQFGQGDDFDKYPRTFEEDCAKLEAEGNTIVFAPDEKQMYPEPQVFYIDLPKVASKLLVEFGRKGRTMANQSTGSVDEELSTREVEVLKLLAAGASNREIADKLVLAEGTVKNHVSNILSKLHAENRTHAANLARERKII